MQQLILDALSRPKDAIFRGMADSLREAFPGRHLLQTPDGTFDVAEFAYEGHCTLVDKPGASSDWDLTYSPRSMGIEQSEFNTWLEAKWEGSTFDVITIGLQTQFQRETRTFLLGPDQETVEAFFLEVCRWASEIRGEVLAFSGGCWTKSKELHQSIQDASFENLILAGDLKERIRQDVGGFFGLRDTYERYRIPWKRGVILLGPPGNGKTHIVKALVNSLGVPCLYVRSFKSQYGTDDGNIQQVFRRARNQAPCILVLEDLDALLNDGNRSFFLNEMDGFASNAGILTLATTNHPERLDPALLERPSRFDRKYTFDLPALAEREAYILMVSEGLEEALKVAPEHAARLARSTEGFSFAYLKELFVSSMMAWVSSGAIRPFVQTLFAQVVPLMAQVSAGIDATAESRESVDVTEADDE
jgi:hypothetical protein